MDVFLQYGLLASILCTGIFVQAAAGFAGGLFIIPILLWCDEGLPEAQASLLVATIPQNSLGLWSLRDTLERKAILWPGIGRVGFLPLGMLVLWLLESTVTSTQLRQLVGGAVLLITMLVILYRPEPREKLMPIWAILAFPISGFCQGLVGMGGPAMVFWVQAHDWSTRRIRGFMFAMYLISIGPSLLILYLFFGDRIIRPALLAAATTPLLMVATALGLRCGTWLGRKRLRAVTLTLLLMVGIAGVFAPMINTLLMPAK